MKSCITKGFLMVALTCLMGFTFLNGDTSGDKSAFTLDQLIGLAEQNNLQIKVSELDKKIAVEEYKGLRSFENPELEYSKGQGEPEEEAHEKKTIWGWSAKWSIPNPFYRYYFLKSKRGNISEAGSLTDIEKNETIREVKTYFYKIELSSKLKSLWEEKSRILEEIYNITKVKVELGESKEIDSLRASMEVQKNIAKGFSMDKTISTERHALRELLDFKIPANFTLSKEWLDEQAKESLTIGPLPFENTTIINNAPSVRLEASRAEREKANLSASRLSLIESIDFFGEQGKELDGKLWKVGVGISIPLFNWKKAEVREAKYLTEKATIQLNQAKKHLISEILRISSEMQILLKQIETFKTSILEVGKQNLEISQKLYKEGEIPMMVLLDAQDSYFETIGNYYEAITEWYILRAEYDALFGGN